MPPSQYIPGMIPGHTLRNAVVTVLYLVTAPIWLFFLWMTLPFAVWYNMDDIGTGLSFLPGISPGGGAVSAGVTFLYLLPLYFVVLSFFPGPLIPSGPDAMPTPANGTATATPTPTPTG